MIKRISLSVIMMLSVSSCTTKKHINIDDITLSELSTQFHKTLDKHNVELSMTEEYFSEYGMYILRVSGSKYFKDNATISIDPEQINEFDEIVLRIKRAMKIIDKDGGKLGGISFSMVYQEKKEFCMINKSYWDEKDSLKEK